MRAQQKLTAAETELATLRTERSRLEQLATRSQEDAFKSKQAVATTKAMTAGAESAAGARSAAIERERAELEDRLANLAARFNEVKNEASAARKEKEEVEAIAARAAQKIALLEDTLMTTENNARTFAERAAEYSSVNLAEIQKLSSENKQLRERHITFDALKEATAAAGGKRAAGAAQPGSAAIAELIKRIEFYEQQLGEADETLLRAKAAFMETGDVMRTRITELELAVQEASAARAATLAAQGEEGLEITRLQQALQKANQRVEKLSEVMSRLELKAVEKNVEMTKAAEERDEALARVERYQKDLDAAVAQVKEAQAESERLQKTLKVISKK